MCLWMRQWIYFPVFSFHSVKKVNEKLRGWGEGITFVLS